MKQLEPGMKCIVIDGEHRGAVLTLVEFVGTPASKIIFHADPPYRLCFEGGDWWLTDTILPWTRSPEIEPDALMPACQLQPIDHRPADEQFTADFKRMINKTPVRA